MQVIEKVKGHTFALSAKEILLSHAKHIGSKLAQKIIKLLSEEYMYPKQLSRKLKEHEQKIYYHIRKLEQANIIEIKKTEYLGGAKTNFYGLLADAFVFRCKEFEKKDEQITTYEAHTFLDPFIQAGKLNAKIIVGSPDPHGPQMARSRDGYYGMDLALFLGTYIHSMPKLSVLLDTEANEKLLKENNLIILGGPIVNAVAAKINDKMPIYIDTKKHCIYSKKSQKEYFADECAMIIKIANPFNTKKHILYIAGLRYAGTRACMIAFTKYFEKIIEKFDTKQKIFTKIIEGYDMNSDGLVDSIKILE